MSNRNRYFEDEVVENKFNKFMLRRLIAYAKDYKATYIKVILLLIGTSFLSLVPVAINRMIINDLLPDNGVVPDNVIATSVILLSAWFVLSLGSVFSGYITNITTWILCLSRSMRTTPISSRLSFP